MLSAVSGQVTISADMWIIQCGSSGLQWAAIGPGLAGRNSQYNNKTATWNNWKLDEAIAVLSSNGTNLLQESCD